MANSPSSTEQTPQDTQMPNAALFDAHYFATGCGQVPYSTTGVWREHFSRIAARIRADIRPSTVLDAGCAMGLLVEHLRDLGVEAEGIDISDYAISSASPHIQPFLRVQSLTQPIAKPYDLIVSIEVLEHLHKPDAEQALANLCQATDDILFSSSPLDYSEPTHFNVQPPEYWAEQFARHGFYRDFDYNADYITDWAVRFRRRQILPHHLAFNYERNLWRTHQQNAELRRKVLDQEWHLGNAAAHIGQIEQRLAERSAEADALHRQIESILTSPGWRFVQTVHQVRKRLAPTGSQREKWLLRMAGRWLSGA